MDMDNEELKKDLEEQYAMLETEIEEDKKKKRYLVIFIFFLVMFLLMFGTTFSYFKIYNGRDEIKEVLIYDLYINEKKDAFVFEKDVKSYVVSMPSNTTQITFGYKICKNCTIEISGNENLKTGSNEIKVKIINKDTKIKDDFIIYVIVENKEEAGSNSNNSNDNNNGNNDEKVINLEVEPINGDGTFIFSNVIPGWESDGMQGIKITNKSNYDAYINLKWTEVINNFNYKNDLNFEVKYNNKIIKSGNLPDKDTYIIKNLALKANSSNTYYFKYKYLYTENDQNIDQGKTFKARVEVTL